MRDSEMKALFLRADEQVPVSEIRKQQVYDVLAEEMKKQRIPVMPEKSILLSQCRYMDKLFLVIYGVLICLGFIIILGLQHMGAGKNEMITACMIGAGILSIMSIIFIDKLFFGRMAELGASCYFNTKQCIATYLVLAGVINLVILIFMAVCLGCYWNVSLLQVGLYIVTPYLTSSMIALGVLSMEQGRQTTYSLGICIVFLSIVYAMISSVPGVLLVTSVWIWGIAFAVSGILCVMQIKRLFRQMEKGEILCMN